MRIANGRRDHNYDLAKGVVFVVEILDQIQRTVEEPLRNYESNLSASWIPRRVQLGTMNYILRT